VDSRYWPEIQKDPDLSNFDLNHSQEITQCNRQSLKENFLKVRDNCKAILEIGIGRNGQDSFATIFFENKKDETVYVGIDIEDRSWLKDHGKNIHIIQGSSSDYDKHMETIRNQFNITEFDFILIDGDHSIDQVLIDWEYTQMLSDKGIVAFHDTTMHLGPYLFIRNLNQDKWDIVPNCCPKDFGIGFVSKK
jgi:predicted GTPase